MSCAPFVDFRAGVSEGENVAEAARQPLLIASWSCGCRSEHCNRVKAKARQACYVLVTMSFRLKSRSCDLQKEQNHLNGVDICNQRKESVENWEAL
eukprot:267279-Amphidinium_carterae.1